MAMAFDPQAKERALQAESARWDTSSPVEAEPGDIPIVDLTKDPGSAAATLRTASEEVGFFQLIGHGIASEELASILSWTETFHALDSATKASLAMDRGWPLAGSGYLEVGHRKLPRRDAGNLNEALIIKTDRDNGFNQNQWPDDAALPGFREAVERYHGLVSEVALRLVPVYAAALDLEEDFFADAFTHPLARLRLSHYPPAPEEKGFGIAPHVDTTFFTLLLQGGPGLTIFSERRQQWINAPVLEDAFVVNSGELLRQWSNDRVLSTRHFARNLSDVDRYSVPFFFNANADYPMECLPSCHGPGNPPKYPTISYLQSQGVVQGE